MKPKDRKKPILELIDDFEVSLKRLGTEVALWRLTAGAVFGWEIGRLVKHFLFR
jgi:hypothetical protein